MALKQCNVLIKGKFLPPQLIENIEKTFTAFRLWEAGSKERPLVELLIVKVKAVQIQQIRYNMR